MSAPDISEDDKNCIIRLSEHLLTKDISRLRVVKYIDHLRVLARMTDKPLRQLGKEDLEKLVSRINAANYAEETKHSYKVV